MSDTVIVRPPDLALRSALRLAAAFALVKLLLHFALTLYTQHLGYGYFRDEFYYIACGRHLAWGYVDHGPIVAVQARIGELLFGTSVFSLRILSAAAGATMVFLTGLLAHYLGGRRPAQALAMLGVLLTPQYLGTDGYLSMNSFEPVFWMLCVLALIRIQQGASLARWWTIFGLSAGIGLLNKPSMTFFLIAVGLSLLCTSQRRLLFTRWAAFGIVLLIVIALPNVFWQIHNHWPTLEFLQNGVKEHKNTVLDLPHFFLAQFGTMHPVNALLWITGIVALLRARSIIGYRWIGGTYLIFFALMFKLHAKDYYVSPIYPVLFAAGAIAWESRFRNSSAVKSDRIIAFPIFEAVLLLTALVILPMSSPVLAPDTWARYTHALHLVGNNTENEKSSILPQFYADRFGWQSEVDQFLSVYHSLPPEDRAHVCIWASNYGEAGALDLLARKQDPTFPPALASQNSYWMWGTHGCTFETVIGITGSSLEELQARYESVQVVGRLDDPLIMPYEHRNIYLLRHRKPSMPVNWNEWKFYI